MHLWGPSFLHTIVSIHSNSETHKQINILPFKVGINIVRNGNSPKTVKTIKTSYGNIGVNVPRVREGEFEPEVIKKRSVVEEGLENQCMQKA